MKQTTINWQIPPTQLTLSSNRIHLWLVNLSKAQPPTKQFTDLLSPKEKTIAEKISATKHRQQYIISRGALRHIINKYIGTEPQHIRFRHGPYGKPYLANTPKRHQISFNLSHSHNLTLIAITRRQNIGIDIERIQPLQFEKTLCNSFFTTQEEKKIQSLPAKHQAAELLKIWTRKEAQLKYCGGKLAALLNQNKSNTTKLSHKLYAHSFTPTKGYIATLVHSQPKQPYSYWKWDKKTLQQNQATIKTTISHCTH